MVEWTVDMLDVLLVEKLAVALVGQRVVETVEWTDV
jgi:hypothetical protein